MKKKLFLLGQQQMKLFSVFQYGERHSKSEVGKTTKALIANSGKYKNYLTSYMQMTERPTYKCPEIESYPILKNHQIIPINRTTYSNKEGAARKIHSRKASTLITLTNSIKPTIEDYRSPPQTATNFYKHRKCLSSRQQPKKKKIDLLKDILFHDENHDNLTYDESKIFHRKQEYQNFILNEIEKVRKGEASHAIETESSILTKTFYPSKDEISLHQESSQLTIKSCIIRFFNLTDPTKPPIEIRLPFSYLPFFYFKNFDNVKYLLIAILKFSSDFESISVVPEELRTLVKNAIEFYNDPPQPKESEDLSRDSESLDSFFSGKIGKIRMTNQNKVKSEFPMSYYNVFSTFWVTPFYTFNIKIRLPEMELKIKNNFILSSFNDELMLYLINKEFVNWDYYVINYLLSFKRVREFLINHLSKVPSQELKSFSLTPTKEKTTTLSSEKFLFFFTESSLKNCIHIVHSYSISVFNSSVNSKNEFIFPFNFKQMKILFQISEIEKIKTFIHKILLSNKAEKKIELNYKVMDILAAEAAKKKPFLKKQIVKSTTVLGIGRGSIVRRKKQSFSFLNNNNVNTNTQQTVLDVRTKSATSSLVINVFEPHLEKIEYISSKEKDNHSTSIISDTNDFVHKVLSKDIINKLCENNISEWPQILYGKIFEEICYNKDGTQKKKRSSFGSKGSRFGMQRRGTMDKAETSGG